MMSIRTEPSAIEATVTEYVARSFHYSLPDIKITKLAGDASTRQYYRASVPDGTSFVVARYPEPLNEISHPTCQITKLFEAAKLPVPKILDVCGHQGLMLLEDLGDIRLQDWLATAHSESCREIYRLAIDLIVQIQDASALANQMDSLAARLAFDEEKLAWELGFFYENYFHRYLNRTISARQKELLFCEFTSLARELASANRVLCHRDYHSRNLMWHHGQLFIIDHQDARMGPVSYDLASLLGDPYVELEERLVQELFEYFVTRRMESGGATFSQSWRAGFKTEYQLMLVQRLMKAVGTYAYQMAVLQNAVYLPYIPRALDRALIAIKQLNRFPTLRAEIEQG